MEMRLNKLELAQQEQTAILIKVNFSLEHLLSLKEDLKDLEDKVDDIEKNVFKTCDRRSLSNTNIINNKEIKMWSAIGSIVLLGLVVIVYMNEVHVNLTTSISKIDKAVVLIDNNQKHMTTQLDKIADAVLFKDNLIEVP